MKLEEIPPYSLRCPTEGEGAPRKKKQKAEEQAGGSKDKIEIKDQTKTM